MTRATLAFFVALGVAPVVVLGVAAAPLAVALIAGAALHRATFTKRADAGAAHVRVYAAAVGWQLLHFGEELATGFATAFPVALGQEPWSPARFIAFNATYMVLFVVGGIGIRSARPLLAVPACSFVVATLVSGPAHTALCIAAGTYAPGIVTAWGSTAFAVVLVRRWTGREARPE